MLGLVWDIIEFLIMAICRIIIYGTLVAFQFIAKSIQALFISDFTLMETFFPVVRDTSSIFIIIALTLIFLIFMWQVFRNFGAGILGDTEDPIPLLFKTLVFTFMIFFSKQVCSMFMKIAGAITTMFWNVDMGSMFDDFGAMDVEYMKNEFSSLINSSSSSASGTETMFESNVVSAVDSTVLGSVISMIIIVFLLVAIMWNFLKLILEIGERYVVMCILYVASPLAFAMGASNSTNQIFKGWCRMFASSLLMMVLNTWSVMLAMSSMRTFVESGSHYTFQYYELQGTNIVKTGAIETNTLVWGILTFAFLKCAQSLDEYLNTMGLSTARTGRGLLEDAFAVGRTMMQTANMVKNSLRMGKMQRALSGNNTAGRGASNGATAASPGVKFNNAAFNSKASSEQAKNFSDGHKTAMSKAGLSDKNINGTKFGAPDSKGNSFGVAPDGTKLMKDANGNIHSQLPGGGTAMRAPNGAFTMNNADGSRVSYDPSTQTKTTVSADGAVTTTEKANGATETVDKNAHKTTQVSPDGCIRETYEAGSPQFDEKGIAAAEYSPHSGATTITDKDGKTSTASSDNAIGPDAGMNAAAMQNAFEDAQNAPTTSSADGADGGSYIGDSSSRSHSSASLPDGFESTPTVNDSNASTVAAAAGVGAVVGAGAAGAAMNGGNADVDIVGGVSGTGAAVTGSEVPMSRGADDSGSNTTSSTIPGSASSEVGSGVGAEVSGGAVVIGAGAATDNAGSVESSVAGGEVPMSQTQSSVGAESAPASMQNSEVSTGNAREIPLSSNNPVAGDSYGDGNNGSNSSIPSGFEVPDSRGGDAYGSGDSADVVVADGATGNPPVIPASEHDSFDAGDAAAVMAGASMSAAVIADSQNAAQEVAQPAYEHAEGNTVPGERNSAETTQPASSYEVAMGNGNGYGSGNVYDSYDGEDIDSPDISHNYGAYGDNSSYAEMPERYNSGSSQYGAYETDGDGVDSYGYGGSGASADGGSVIQESRDGSDVFGNNEQFTYDSSPSDAHYESSSFDSVLSDHAESADYGHGSINEPIGSSAIHESGEGSDIFGSNEQFTYGGASSDTHYDSTPVDSVPSDRIESVNYGYGNQNDTAGGVVQEARGGSNTFDSNEQFAYGGSASGIQYESNSVGTVPTDRSGDSYAQANVVVNSSANAQANATPTTVPTVQEQRGYAGERTAQQPTNAPQPTTQTPTRYTAEPQRTDSDVQRSGNVSEQRQKSNSSSGNRHGSRGSRRSRGKKKK